MRVTVETFMGEQIDLWLEEPVRRYGSNAVSFAFGFHCIQGPDAKKVIAAVEKVTGVTFVNHGTVVFRESGGDRWVQNSNGDEVMISKAGAEEGVNVQPHMAPVWVA